MTAFLDHILTVAPEAQDLLDSDAADLTAGVTWGLYDGDRLLVSYPSRFQAEMERLDCADAADRPVSSFSIREVEHAEVVTRPLPCCSRPRGSSR